LKAHVEDILAMGEGISDESNYILRSEWRLMLFWEDCWKRCGVGDSKISKIGREGTNIPYFGFICKLFFLY